MKLSRLHIDGFGALVEEDFEFGPNLNIVLGPNEAGKSTLQQALLTMLYGVYQGGRSSPLEKRTHARFRPWSGAKYGGSLYLASNSGEEFLITRKFDYPEPETHIFDAKTGREITDQFTRKRRGFVDFIDRHLGMSKPVFEAVACVKQGDLTTLSKHEAQEIADTIIRLVDSAATDVSARMALNRLSAAIRMFGTERSKSGPLFRAYQTMNDCKRKIDERQKLSESLAEDYARLHEITEEISFLVERESALKKDLQSWNYHALKNRFERFQKLSVEKQALQRKVDQTSQLAVISQHDRDQVLKWMTLRKRLKHDRDMRMKELETSEKTLAEKTIEIEAIPVDKEFWQKNQDASFFEIQQEWEKLDAQKSDRERDAGELEKIYDREGLTPEVRKALDELGGEKHDDIRKNANAVAERSEEIHALEESRIKHRKISSFLRGATGLILTAILLLSSTASTTVQENILAMTQAADWLEYVVGTIILLWLTFEYLLANSVRHIEESLSGEKQALLIAQSFMKKNLQPFRVTVYEELLDLQIKYTKLQSLHSQAAANMRDIEAREERLLDWFKKFHYDAFSKEHLQAIKQQLKIGRKSWDDIRSLKERISGIEQYLSERDDKLDEATDQIKKTLEKADCWSGVFEEDTTRFLELANSTQKLDLLHGELKHVSAREQELIDGTTPEALETNVFELRKLLGDGAATPPTTSQSELSESLSQAQRKLQNLKVEHAALQERIAERETKLPDLSELEEMLATTETEIEEMTTKRQALELAYETLRNIAAEAHKDFAPRLAQNISNRLATITDNRYQELYIDPADFTIRVAHGEARTLTELEFLSFGVQEIVYLLMRSSIAQLFSNASESVPLFFDDPLAHADDKRKGNVLLLLSRLAEQQQLFYFTKDQTIADELAEYKIDYNLITLRRSDETKTSRNAWRTSRDEDENDDYSF